MRRGHLQQLARNELRNATKDRVVIILDTVNLSPQEHEVIERNEINREDLESICNSFKTWGSSERKKGRVCSYPNIVRIKKNGMEKIGRWLQNDNKSIKK